MVNAVQGIRLGSVPVHRLDPALKCWARWLRLSMRWGVIEVFSMAKGSGVRRTAWCWCWASFGRLAVSPRMRLRAALLGVPALT